MSTRQYLKHLRLVTPWTAVRLGIRAEAPVFISPWAHEQARCDCCNRIYSPLVYQTGYETAAQHQCGSGGIYCHVCADPQVALQLQSGWIAQVEPCGWQVVYGDTLQAAAVRVLGMEAWCMGWLPSVAPTCHSLHGHHRVSSGHLVSSPACDRFRELLPICDELPLSARRAPFRFHIRDGQVFFTKRS
jgi:hypothetical protein